MARCGLCYKDKPRLDIMLPNTQPVCRGCAIDIDRLIGWLEYQGFAIQLSLLGNNVLVDTNTGELHASVATTPLAPLAVATEGVDTLLKRSPTQSTKKPRT